MNTKKIFLQVFVLRLLVDLQAWPFFLIQILSLIQAEVEYVINKSRGSIVDIFPVGAVTKNSEEKELAEIYDMHKAGAIAFSDAQKQSWLPD
jgi:hypothetical protein